MFERYTERARQAVVLAQDEARAMKHNYIGTEHLLLGLLREKEGVAAAALANLGFTADETRAAISTMIPNGDEVTSGQIPFTPRAKKILELSLREALSMGHNYIGTEHVLLGLVREGEGFAARVIAIKLEENDHSAAGVVRNEVIRILSGPLGSRRMREAEIERAGPGEARSSKNVAIAATRAVEAFSAFGDAFRDFIEVCRDEILRLEARGQEKPSEPPL